MKRPRELRGWEFPDTITVRNGYDLEDMPRMSDENFRLLVDEYNNLVEVVNRMIDGSTGIEFDD